MIGLLCEYLHQNLVSLPTATKTTTKSFSKCFDQSSPNDSPLGRLLPGEMEYRETIKGEKIKHE